jgi:hypothetical protein
MALRDEELDQILVAADGGLAAAGGGGLSLTHAGAGRQAALATSGLAKTAVLDAWAASGSGGGRRSYEAVHRERYLPAAEREGWELHCTDMLSGDRFKPLIFAKSVLYELLPAWAAVWVIIGLEGGNHKLAVTRLLSPFTVAYWTQFRWFMDLFALLPAISFAVWALYRDEETAGIDVWEVGFTLMLTLLRALVVATKYAYYTDLEVGSDVGLLSRNYEVEERLTKKLAANWVTNSNNKLRSVLLEELYEASLRVDCDLSKTCFAVEPAVAQAVWSVAKRSLEQACDEAHAVAAGFSSQIDAPQMRQKWGRGFALRQTIFGSGADVEASVARGLLPASVVAWKCCCDGFYITKAEGGRRTQWLLVLTTVLAFVAPVTRLLLGRSAFGDTGPAKVV